MQNPNFELLPKGTDEQVLCHVTYVLMSYCVAFSGTNDKLHYYVIDIFTCGCQGTNGQFLRPVRWRAADGGQ